MGKATSRPFPQWPFAELDTGAARVEVHHLNGCAFIVLGISLNGLSASERKRMLDGPVKIVWRPVPDLLVFVVQTSIMTYDAPFCPGLNGASWHVDLVRALQGPVPPTLEVAFVHDTDIRRCCKMTTGPSTRLLIALAMDHCPTTMCSVEYDDALCRYQSLYQPSDLLNATIISHTGRGGWM